MYCTNCGVRLEEKDRFCSQCGRATGKEEPVPAGFPPRRLSRAMGEKNIAGVCAGFARYLQVDVVLVRVIWLVLAVATGGIGLIAYLAAWIIMPKDYQPAPATVYQRQGT